MVRVSLGASDVIMSVPQLEIHPFSPGAAVPGAPVDELEGLQKSPVVPHWPQILQHAFNGHWFKVLKSVLGGALTVSFTCGPQTAFGTLAGIGGYPVLRQIL
jgi:hypothetical protein